MFRKATPAELAHYMGLIAPKVATEEAVYRLWQSCTQLAPPRTVEKSRRLREAVFDQGEPWSGTSQSG